MHLARGLRSVPQSTAGTPETTKRDSHPGPLKRGTR
jgi:hypothetical protein